MPNKPKTTDLYDVATLSISNDPFIGRQRKEGSKYDPIFSKLKIGQPLVRKDVLAREAKERKAADKADKAQAATLQESLI